MFDIKRLEFYPVCELSACELIFVLIQRLKLCGDSVVVSQEEKQALIEALNEYVLE